MRNTTHCRRSASRVARERDAAKKPIAEPSEAKKMPKSCSESSCVAPFAAQKSMSGMMMVRPRAWLSACQVSVDCVAVRGRRGQQLQLAPIYAAPTFAVAEEALHQRRERHFELLEGVHVIVGKIDAVEAAVGRLAPLRRVARNASVCLQRSSSAAGTQAHTTATPLVNQRCRLSYAVHNTLRAGLALHGGRLARDEVPRGSAGARRREAAHPRVFSRLFVFATRGASRVRAHGTRVQYCTIAHVTAPS